MLNIKFDSKNLYQAMSSRISVRNYKKQKLLKKDYDYLNQKLEYINSLNMGVKAYLINQDNEDIFTGIIGSYGKIKNAPSYFLLVGDTSNENIYALVGYVGEYLVLEVQAKNMSTCWVSGTFKKSKLPREVIINSNEKVFCVISVGYRDQSKSDFAKKVIKSANRKPVDKLVLNHEKLLNVPEYIQKSIEYARIAPSAINRQPWKFRVYEKEIDLLLDKGIIKIDRLIESKKLDLGIALFHIVVVLNHYNKEFNISFEKEVFAKITVQGTLQ
ncbi:MAG: nitroreductase family protein [Clostridium sp.]|uniref:nitroreductase family protein n=1 Tax=Clostridium sp. TaxID=1506 RepID=UPI003D6D8366